MLETGLYEQIINQAIQDELAAMDAEQFETAQIDRAEAPLVLSQYVAETLQSVLRNIDESSLSNEQKQRKQTQIVNRIIQLMHDTDDATASRPETTSSSSLIIEPAKELQQIRPSSDEPVYQPALREIRRPITSIRSSSLFTGAVHEPSMEIELRNEISSADRIDMLVSFIKFSGLRLIYDELRDFCQAGGQLRVITTSYLGATDIKAVERLAELPNCELKVSYDTKVTRLHAKAYIFYRKTGFSTAYIGSSNLSGPAISSGLEWNVKIASKELPETMQKVEMTFDSYWASPDYIRYDETQYHQLRQALSNEGSSTNALPRHFFYDLHPYPFQQEILDRLEAERSIHGRFRNLVVAATGTGKTVIAAFDYKRFKSTSDNPAPRLLFIAHRREILEQSLDTYRQVLRDPNFGDLFVGSEQPSQIEHLFMSVQTFKSRSWERITAADFYDYIVIDEFHHAAADSYQILLHYYQPKILLGLTATPERMDGEDVTAYFQNRIAAEIRLPEAIERKLLAPFQYFGVTDSIDLDQLKWSRGGYDRSELSKIYTIDEAVAWRRVREIKSALDRYVTDIDKVSGLGFCVSVEHAHFMANSFNQIGIPSLALSGGSNDHERKTAKSKLQKGELRFIFTVDLYNEGVDIPEINTVLFLRPTESLTVFLQQLGRGLRLAPDKDCLTVLDFIGQAHQRYDYQEKFKALLANTKRRIKDEIDQGFPSVPKGCFIRLEKLASEYVLRNIRQATNTKRGLIERLASFQEDSGYIASLENFMNYYHLSPLDIYRHDSFARLKVAAGLIPDFREPDEKELKTALKRLSYIDSGRWIDFIDKFMQDENTREYESFTAEEQRQLWMLYFTLQIKESTLDDAALMVSQLYDLKRNVRLMNEIQDLLYWNYDHIDHVSKRLNLGFANPLDLHCSYSRDQLLAAFSHRNPRSVREGVEYFPELKLDVLMVTLNKSDKDYSPTTMYEDYSISDTLFHWQSQSTTSEFSPTGQRYINHRRTGNQILLFVRESKQDEYGNTMPYTCLGLVDYLSHTGSKPMSITFRLHEPIPAKQLRMTDKVQAG